MGWFARAMPSRRTALRWAAFCKTCPLCPSKPMSRAYGPARFATRERKRDALDKLIAAHATALNVVLVTNNEADFSAYPGLCVENWVDRH